MKTLGIVGMLVLTGCGYSSRQNELVGQVKKVVHQTPIICGDRVDADVSLGIIRNGVGSMSSEDIWLTVPNKEDQVTLTKANQSGKAVKIHYDEARVAFCKHHHLVTDAAIEE